MKSFSIIASFIALTLVSKFASAQTDNATLNVRLYPIQTILINPSQKVINLDYKTVGDYANGVEVAEANHLTVYSTGAFSIKVKSATSSLTGTKSNIEASDVLITPLAGTTSKLDNATLAAHNLSATDQVIISSTVGSVNKNFDIKYKSEGSNKYVNKYFNTENPTVYTTSVTYTIEAN